MKGAVQIQGIQGLVTYSTIFLQLVANMDQSLEKGTYFYCNYNNHGLRHFVLKCPRTSALSPAHLAVCLWFELRSTKCGLGPFMGVFSTQKALPRF